MAGVWSIWEPGMNLLRDADLDGVEHEMHAGPLLAARRMTALDLPLREQAARIASGEIDAGELLDACLARIEERNPELNAIVATFPDQSREMLEAAPDGPLRGVPVVIKDEWPLPWRAETVGAAAVPGRHHRSPASRAPTAPCATRER